MPPTPRKAPHARALLRGRSWDGQLCAGGFFLQFTRPTDLTTGPGGMGPQDGLCDWRPAGCEGCETWRRLRPT